MITIFTDAYLRAPRVCKRCEIMEAEFGPFCWDCYIDWQEEAAEHARDE